MTYPGFIIVLILTTLLSGCGMADLFSTPELRGEVRGDVYVGPEGRFRVRIPPLREPKGQVSEGSPAAGVLEVFFEDNLCRRFMVSEQLDVMKDMPLMQWVNDRVVGEFDRLGLGVRERREISTKHGPTVFMRYTSPAASPCTKMVTIKGNKEEVYESGEVGVYVVRGGGFIYMLTYIVGINPALGDASMPPRGPLDELLAGFAEGFEILPGKAKVMR